MGAHLLKQSTELHLRLIGGILSAVEELSAKILHSFVMKRLQTTDGTHC
jgi:hypothetical protein